MRRISIVFRREISGYFATPLAAIFLVVFLFLTSMFAFNIGGFFDRGQADLRPFFQFHPWLYLFLVPAISMRLWAEERRTGTIELIATLPLTMQDLVLGKFFAAWAFSGLALLLTVPIWWTVSFLGDPDHGVIVCSYFASWLTAGAFLAIGSAISSLTKNQVVAFVLCAAACFLLLLSGFSVVLDFFRSWAPNMVVEGLSAIGVLTHFDSMVRGVIDLRDVLYFASLIVAFLVINTAAIDWRKAA